MRSANGVKTRVNIRPTFSRRRFSSLTLLHPHPNLLSPPHQDHNRHKTKHTAPDNKQDKCNVVSNPLAEINHVKRKREAKALSQEVEQGSHISCGPGPYSIIGGGGRVAAALDTVGITGRRNGLHAEDTDGHAEQRDEPVHAVLDGEAVNEQADGYQDRARPDGLQPRLGLNFLTSAVRMMMMILTSQVLSLSCACACVCPLHNPIQHDPSNRLPQDAPDRQRPAVRESDLERVPRKGLFEDGRDGDSREDGGEAVLRAVVGRGEQDGRVLGHAQGRPDERTWPEFAAGEGAGVGFELGQVRRPPPLPACCGRCRCRCCRRVR